MAGNEWITPQVFSAALSPGGSNAARYAPWLRGFEAP